MGIPNTNSGQSGEPFLRVDLVKETLDGLPDHLQRSEREFYQYFKAHGFTGIQNGDPDLCRQEGLRYTMGGRVERPGDAAKLIAQASDRQADCLTVHVGTGFESDDQMDRLVEDILKAADQACYPLYIETHRATITQDMYRTVRLTERFPEIRFNGDFSHWYTGQEMRYGRFTKMEEKFAFLRPVFERVRFIHGRIGNGGCMQLDITRPDMGINVGFFREMWTRCFHAFQKSAAPGDYIIFAPELLDSEKHYAVTAFGEGQLRETGNRIEEAVLYKGLAQGCWEEAASRENMAG